MSARFLRVLRESLESIVRAIVTFGSRDKRFYLLSHALDLVRIQTAAIIISCSEEGPTLRETHGELIFALFPVIHDHASAPAKRRRCLLGAFYPVIILEFSESHKVSSPESSAPAQAEILLLRASGVTPVEIVRICGKLVWSKFGVSWMSAQV